MPATRRSSRVAAAKSTAKQSTLSFNNRVSKAGAAKVSAKEAAAAVAAAALTPPASSPPTERKAVEPSEEADIEVDQSDALVDDEEEEEVAKVEVRRPSAEVRAERVTDAQVKRYWREVEAVRIAKRVHQKNLSLAEKVLRYFDISSQYGVSSKNLQAPSLSHSRHLLTLVFSPYLGVEDLT